MLASIEEMNYR